MVTTHWINYKMHYFFFVDAPATDLNTQTKHFSICLTFVFVNNSAVYTSAKKQSPHRHQHILDHQWHVHASATLHAQWIIIIIDNSHCILYVAIKQLATNTHTYEQCNQTHNPAMHIVYDW